MICLSFECNVTILYIGVGFALFCPIYVKQKISKLKSWGCIFVFMPILAIHVELVELLDNDCFINAMQQTINRQLSRGWPSLIGFCGTKSKEQSTNYKLKYQGLISLRLETSLQNKRSNGCWIHLHLEIWKELGKEWFERFVDMFSEVEIVVNNRS